MSEKPTSFNKVLICKPFMLTRYLFLNGVTYFSEYCDAMMFVLKGGTFFRTSDESQTFTWTI